MRLSVGDLAVITGSRFYPEIVGQICTVIAPYEERLCLMPDGSKRWMYRYLIRRLDGEIGAASFRNLRSIDGEHAEHETSSALSESDGQR